VQLFNHTNDFMNPPDKLWEFIRFDENGLIPVIAQQRSGQDLMLAWMNRTALE